jgi:uncharacterized protein (DUF2344 family)
VKRKTQRGTMKEISSNFTNSFIEDIGNDGIFVEFYERENERSKDYVQFKKTFYEFSSKNLECEKLTDLDKLNSLYNMQANLSTKIKNQVSSDNSIKKIKHYLEKKENLLRTKFEKECNFHLYQQSIDALIEKEIAKQDLEEESQSSSDSS